MGHEVEKVLCQGCGVSFPEDEVNAEGLCSDCVRKLEALALAPMAVDLADKPDRVAHLLRRGDSYLDLETTSKPWAAQDLLEQIRAYGEEDTRKAHEAWEAGRPEREAAQARGRARKAIRKERERVALIRGEALLQRQLRRARKLLVTHGIIRAFPHHPELADQYRGQRESEVADILGLVAALRVVRRKRAKLEHADDVVDALTLAWRGLRGS